jgi:hypothetical protein
MTCQVASKPGDFMLGRTRLFQGQAVGTPAPERIGIRKRRRVTRFIEGMENFAIKGGTVYTCMSGESVTGKALLFQTLPFNARLGPFCG